MDKIDLSLSILAGIALVGVIWLLAISRSVEILLPILTALVGALIGARKPQIVGYFKK
jgi:ribose/xylose/arabinose/galactoside ABC-type transport system permease subunit